LISLEKTYNKFIPHKNTKLFIKHNQRIGIKCRMSKLIDKKQLKKLLEKHLENGREIIYYKQKMCCSM